MKTDKITITKEGKIDGKLTINGEVSVRNKDGEQDIKLLGVVSNPNWFQRLIYKLLGLKIIE